MIDPRLMFPVPFGVTVMFPLVTPVVIAKLFTSRFAFRVFMSLSLPYNSTKLSFILSNAVLNGSPVPSFALEPILITCLAILYINPLFLNIYRKFYKPNVIIIGLSMFSGI